MEDKELEEQLKEAKNKALEALSSVEEALPLPDMYNQVSNTVDRSRTNWTPPMDRYFIDLMLDQVRMGQKGEKSFTKYAWTRITFSFNKKFEMQLDKDVLKNRYKKLKHQYVLMKTLITQGGFGWDDSRQMVTAEDESMWDGYLKAHPEAKSLRTKVMPNYYDLNVIFANTSGSGNSTRVTKDANCGNSVTKDANSGGAQAPQSPPVTVTHNDEDEVVGAEDDSSPSDAEQEMHNLKRKESLLLPSTSQQPRKLRKTTCERLVDAITTMAMAISSLVDKKKDESSKSINVVQALDAIPDLDDDLYLEACDLLEDDRKSKIFVALDVPKRRKWLVRKLRPYTNS